MLLDKLYRRDKKGFLPKLSLTLGHIAHTEIQAIWFHNQFSLPPPTGSNLQKIL